MEIHRHAEPGPEGGIEAFPYLPSAPDPVIGICKAEPLGNPYEMGVRNDAGAAQDGDEIASRGLFPYSRKPNEPLLVLRQPMLADIGGHLAYIPSL